MCRYKLSYMPNDNGAAAAVVGLKMPNKLTGVLAFKTIHKYQRRTRIYVPVLYVPPAENIIFVHT